MNDDDITPIPDAEPDRIVNELAWAEHGACVGLDPALFFPDRGESTTEAKRVCSTCTVRTDCLDYALRHTERFGIWGGLSERERRRIRRQRAQQQRGAA